MVAIGMGIAWFGYAVGLWGYCLVKQYDVTFGQLVYPTGQMSWPPPPVAQNVNAVTPQPTVAAQYLAPLTLIATAIGSLVGGAGDLIGGAAGAAGSVAGPAMDQLRSLLGLGPQEHFAAGEVPGTAANPQLPGGWTVTDQSAQTGWTVTDLSGR